MYNYWEDNVLDDYFNSIPNLNSYYDFSYSDKELEYFSSMHPSHINELALLVSKECDRLDYNGSIIYDEYPDKVMFSKICSDIFALANLTCKYAMEANEKNKIKDIINILFSREVYKRRKTKKKYTLPKYI